MNRLNCEYVPKNSLEIIFDMITIATRAAERSFIGGGGGGGKDKKRAL